jgi:exodeoxyribonuclease V alpha subunit
LSTTKLEGEILGFTYQAESGGFAVARLLTQDGEAIAVGGLGHVTPGQHVALFGSWAVHPSFGRQFKVERSLVDDPQTLNGLSLYLQSGDIRGMGGVLAKRVVDHFGLDTLQVLNSDPARLLEINGIGRKKLEQITTHWRRDQAHRETRAELHGLGFGSTIAQRLVARYGEDALAVLRKEPYRISAEIRGIGFKTADQVALAQGMDPSDPVRAKAGIVHTLREAEGQGHCYLPWNKLVERTVRLDIGKSVVESTADRLLAEGGIVAPENFPERMYRPAVAHIERRISLRLKGLANAQVGSGQLFGGEAVETDMATLESAIGLRLHPQQQRAVEVSLNEGMTVVTGGPGTGKTTIVRFLVSAAQAQGESWLLAAPTGRAAKRLAEATSMEAQTVHRLLGYNGHSRRFTHGPSNPLEASAVLIDEASMLDIWLVDALLAAVRPGTRLILVGDVDQLPSVGPGRVLGDIIESGKLPVVRLTEVYRQARESNIVRNAHRINAGQAPISCEKDPEAGPMRDFFVLGRAEPEEAKRTLLDVVSRNLVGLGFEPMRDVQVLTPMHSGPLGTQALNIALQRLLNPSGRTHMVRDREFRVGDRVLQVRNDYDREVYNGDIGRVVDASSEGLSVRFDGRVALVSGSDLELAYAISIHKSQGSEYPAVIAVVHSAHRIMLRRNLIYTAITRAKRFCCIIGHPWAIAKAASDESGGERWTSLEALLRESGSGEEPRLP